MAKKRTIPFGYQMKNGKITTHPDEVLAVVTIFNDYLTGKSLKEISAQMDVPYMEGVLWNKHMVKRILENPRYLGTDQYPQLISEEVFQTVQETKTERAKSIRMIPEDMQELANITFCKECGYRLFRNDKRKKKWNCLRKECYPFEFQLTDQMLIGAVLHVLNSVIANPDLLEMNSMAIAYTPTADIICQQNKIHHMLNKPQIDFESIQNEIYKLAEMKYASCHYSNVPRKTEYLKLLLHEKTQMNCLDTDILKTCIKRVLVSHHCTIEVEFINGAVIQNITERSEKE